jgi:hypothetical protein
MRELSHIRVSLPAHTLLKWEQKNYNDDCTTSTLLYSNYATITTTSYFINIR